MPLTPNTELNLLFPDSLISGDVKRALHQDLHIRPLASTDYNRGHLSVLSVLTEISDPGEAAWKAQFDALRALPDTYYVLVILDRATDKIIGVGTLVVERKFTRGLGKVGHIEDIAVDKAQQGKKIGLRIINALTYISETLSCYKTILNCSESNVPFYEKCGFEKKECEMRINPGKVYQVRERTRTTIIDRDWWTSTSMSDADWALACKRYNDPTTFIDPQLYRKNLPRDSVHRDAISLKKMRIEFEASCQKWKTLLDIGQESEVSTWKQMHLKLPIPERAISISREGRQTKLKVWICCRCCKVKDGIGRGKGHPRDKCDDGLPIWKAVPYPLPTNLVTFRNSHWPIISPEACGLAHFKELMKRLNCAQGNFSAFSQEMQTLYTFEKFARQDPMKSFEETLIAGKSAYNFSSEQFLGKLAF